MANPTMLEIATAIGGLQPELVDALVGDNGSALFRVLPMKAIIGLTEQFIQKSERPTVAFRNFAGKVTASKTGKIPVQEGVFMLSGASELDAPTTDKTADPDQERADEALSFLESIGYKLSYSSFYGSNKIDGGYDGLLKRLPTTAETYVAGGASNETVSIYGLKLGRGKFQGIYNPGPGGEIIQTSDFGKIAVKDSNGQWVSSYVTMFDGCFGLAQYHPKAIGRIGKLDSSHKPTAAMITSLFQKMKWKPDVLITNMEGAGWLNELKQAVMKMSPDDPNFDISMSDYNGIPILVDSAIVDDENTVTV